MLRSTSIGLLVDTLNDIATALRAARALLAFVKTNWRIAPV
jgi:hypothetical protein